MNYVGQELELFAKAANWKRYFADRLEPYVQGRVLEVGCGMGVNAEYLLNPGVTAYTFLEPDDGLLAHVLQHVRSPLLRNAERVHGTTNSLTGRQFDTILYLDVIEHIEYAKAELERAMVLLAPGGHLVILVPAYNFLFSAFDGAIGHFRRYDRRMLQQELPTGLETVSLKYLDSCGLVLSLANKLLLRQRMPTDGQIRFWDRTVVPISKVTDRLLFHSCGRSLLAVARKPA